MNTGDIVILYENEAFLKEEFIRIGYGWDDRMRDMMGQLFPILSTPSSSILTLPSPDGGAWYFSCTMVTKSGECILVLIFKY